MSSVPYTFANQTGNIPLSQLDANFSNVKASVDFAIAANTAVSAYQVTANAQPAITSVGTLTSLSVTGNVTAGTFIGTFSGNVSNAVYANTAGTVTTNAQPNITSVGTLTTLSVSGNIDSANIQASGTITGGTITTPGNIFLLGRVSAAGNLVAAGNVGGNFVLGNTVLGSIITSAGNLTGANILTNGSISANGELQILAATSVPVGGTAGAGLKMSSTANLGIFFGSGTPTLAAAQGSLYLNTTGNSTSNRMYINTDGSTTWTNVTTAA